MQAVNANPAVNPQEAMEKLMGLAIFGEKVAAKTYLRMADLKPEHGKFLRKFAAMEGQHAAWFMTACEKNAIVPNREFADNELGYLVSQVDDHYAQKDPNALAILQGFIVESLAIATYEPFLKIAPKYEGALEPFQKALEEEHYHVDWVTRYLRLQFFDKEEEFLALAERVNIQGIDCIGGTMMNIADCLSSIGLSGADCAGVLMDGYTELLETIGIEQKKATKNVVSLFMPLIRKYRHGEKTK